MYYSIRLLYLVFISEYHGFKIVIKNHVKTTNIEFIVLGLLGVLSIGTGYCFKEFFVSMGSHYFNNVIWSLPCDWSLINLEFIPARIKLIPLATGIVALLLALNLSIQFNKVAHIVQSKTYLEMCKWYYNEILNAYIAWGSLHVGRHFFDQYEKRSLENNGPIFFVSSVEAALFRISSTIS